jgi:PhnB protein
MNIVPYLNFNGTCREAFEFYQKVFGGEIKAMITHEDVGIPGLDEQTKSLILHARLDLENHSLMASDVSQEPNATPVPVQVSIHLESVEESERIYHELSQDGNIMMPMEKQDWAERFAFFSDRFGIPWMITCSTG